MRVGVAVKKITTPALGFPSLHWVRRMDGPVSVKSLLRQKG